MDCKKSLVIGPRTHKDILKGRDIRKHEDGGDVFEDYWTDTDEESYENSKWLSRKSQKTLNTGPLKSAEFENGKTVAKYKNEKSAAENEIEKNVSENEGNDIESENNENGFESENGKTENDNEESSTESENKENADENEVIAGAEEAPYILDICNKNLSPSKQNPGISFRKPDKIIEKTISLEYVSHQNKTKRAFEIAHIEFHKDSQKCTSDSPLPKKYTTKIECISENGPKSSKKSISMIRNKKLAGLEEIFLQYDEYDAKIMQMVHQENDSDKRKNSSCNKKISRLHNDSDKRKNSSCNKKISRLHNDSDQDVHKSPISNKKMYSTQPSTSATEKNPRSNACKNKFESRKNSPRHNKIITRLLSNDTNEDSHINVHKSPIISKRVHSDQLLMPLEKKQTTSNICKENKPANSKNTFSPNNERIPILHTNNEPHAEDCMSDQGNSESINNTDKDMDITSSVSLHTDQNKIKSFENIDFTSDITSKKSFKNISKYQCTRKKHVKTANQIGYNTDSGEDSQFFLNKIDEKFLESDKVNTIDNFSIHSNESVNEIETPSLMKVQQNKEQVENDRHRPKCHQNNIYEFSVHDDLGQAEKNNKRARKNIIKSTTKVHNIHKNINGIGINGNFSCSLDDFSLSKTMSRSKTYATKRNSSLHGKHEDQLSCAQDKSDNGITLDKKNNSNNSLSVNLSERSFESDNERNITSQSPSRQEIALNKTNIFSKCSVDVAIEKNEDNLAQVLKKQKTFPANKENIPNQHLSKNVPKEKEVHIPKNIKKQKIFSNKKSPKHSFDVSEINEGNTLQIQATKEKTAAVKKHISTQGYHFSETHESENLLSDIPEGNLSMRSHKETLIDSKGQFSSTDKIRRSSRKRYAPLAHWRNERILYRYEGDEIKILGVDKGTKQDDGALKRINAYTEKRVLKHIKPKKVKLVNSVDKIFSVHLHKKFPLIPWDTPASGVPKKNSDYDYLIKTMIRTPRNSFGYLKIGSGKEKPPQYMPEEDLQLTVVKGEIEIKVQENVYTLSNKDMFIVPCNTAYSIKNVGTKKALLAFAVGKFKYMHT